MVQIGSLKVVVDPGSPPLGTEPPSRQPRFARDRLCRQWIRAADPPSRQAAYEVDLRGSHTGDGSRAIGSSRHSTQRCWPNIPTFGSSMARGPAWCRDRVQRVVARATGGSGAMPLHRPIRAAPASPSWNSRADRDS